jgi:hypothetical protein
MERHSGVWLSNIPLDENEGAKGDVLLRIDLDTDVARFEWIEDGKPYREWLIPASIVNTGTVRHVTSDEEDELARADFKARLAMLPPELRAEIEGASPETRGVTTSNTAKRPRSPTAAKQRISKCD